jgi:hypothetical protein
LRLLVPECDRAGHQAPERRDLRDRPDPVRQRLAEQHEAGLSLVISLVPEIAMFPDCR